MKTEQDQQRHPKVVKTAINKLMFIGCVLLAVSCNHKKSVDATEININVIGSYIPNQRFRLKVENAVLFDEILKIKTLKDRRLVYYPQNQDSVKIDFSVNDHDTSFIYHLEKKNFLQFGESFAYKQLLVSKVDSAEYWKGVHDYVEH